MRVIDEDLELAFCRNRLEPAGDLRRTAETQDGLANADSHAAGRGESGHRIGDVESPDQRDAHQITLASRIELVRGARKFGVITRGAKIGPRPDSTRDDGDFAVEPIDQL